MPAAYPKCNPTEMMGLLALLNQHKGEEDVARLADDLDLEIDEIFPSLEFAEVLQLIKVKEGRTSFTDLGRRLAGASIRERKSILRDQLKRTSLFRTLLKALEQAPGHRLTGEEVARLVSFTSASGEEAVQNIINWGRYADLLRYDSDRHVLQAVRRNAGPRAGSGRLPPPPAGGPSPSEPAKEAAEASLDPPLDTRPVVSLPA